MTRGIASAVALLRRLRQERAVVVLLFVLVAVTSLAVAAGPRLFNRVSDDGLRYAADHATAAQRNLQFLSVDRFEPSDGGPFDGVTARGASLRDGLPETVRGLIGQDHYVVDLPRFRVADPPNLRTFVTLRWQDGLDGRVDLVDGRWPLAVPPPTVAPEPGSPEAEAPPRFEFALSQQAADLIGMAVGDTWRANVDPSDPVLANVFPRPVTEVELTLVGRFTVGDGRAPFWFDDHALEAAGLAGPADDPIAYTTGLFAPDAYGDLLGLGIPASYHWREFVDTTRLDAGKVDDLVPELTRLEATYSSAGAIRSGSTIARTGLLDIVQRYLHQRGISTTALSIASLGPLTVAGGAVGLIGVLVVRRRHPALSLARARGASARQVLEAQLWEGVLIAVPAALAGLAVAVAAIPARASDLSGAGVIAVAGSAIVLLVAATWPVARRARRDLEREDPPAFRLSPRRLVFEAVVIGLSLAVAWLLRQRGLAATGVSGTSTGFDPLLAASPVLIGLAVALLTIRVYPLPVRGLGWLLARRRDLVPVLGLRNLGRRPTAGHLPLLIVMLTVAIGTFSSVVQFTIERSQFEAAWRQVGADFRIDSPTGSGLAERIDPSAVPGVEAAAPGLIDSDVSIETSPGRRSSWLFVAIDPARYPAVVAESPVAIGIPAWFGRVASDPTAGTPANPIPAALSTTLPTGSDEMTIGTTFQASINGRQLTFRVGGRVDAFPGIAARTPFIIAPYPVVAAAGRGSPLRPTTWFVRGPESLDGALRDLVGTGPGAAGVTSRYDRFGALHDAPLVAGVAGGFLVALLVAMAYAVVAVVAVIVLHAPRRSRELAVLRTLGLSDRQALGLLFLEQGLPVLLALAIGLGLGAGLAWFLAPGLNLAVFSDPASPVRLQADPGSLAAVAGLVVAVVAAAVALSTWLARRLHVSQVLRIGEP